MDGINNYYVCNEVTYIRTYLLNSIYVDQFSVVLY